MLISESQSYPDSTSVHKGVLVVVDIQRDFCKGGIMAIPDSESLIPPLNAAIRTAKSLGVTIVFTRDWHPADHDSFAPQGGQWPPHCVAGTLGAEFHKDLYVPDDAHIVSKGTSSHGTGYSPYESSEMNQIMKNAPSPICVAGIALEYCVKATCVDTLMRGKRTVALMRLVRSVSSDRRVIEAVWRDLLRAGCEISEEFPLRCQDHT